MKIHVLILSRAVPSAASSVSGGGGSGGGGLSFGKARFPPHNRFASLPRGQYESLQSSEVR